MNWRGIVVVVVVYVAGAILGYFQARDKSTLNKSRKVALLYALGSLPLAMVVLPHIQFYTSMRGVYYPPPKRSWREKLRPVGR
jgi:hypothetical protein